MKLPIVTDLDADHITSGLWVGARPPLGDYLARQGHHTVILCANEYQPPTSAFKNVQVLHCPMDDDFFTPVHRMTIHQIENVAIKAIEALQSGQTVVSTCFSGLNRSALTAGVILHHMYGMSGEKILDLIRSRREHALINPKFEQYLLSLPART